MQQYATQADYLRQVARRLVQEQGTAVRAGLRVFDISTPAAPREIAYLHMPGFGAHRIWWVGGRYAYVSVHLDGFNRSRAGHHRSRRSGEPVLAGHWWLPGMWRAGGETPPASFGKRTALHHISLPTISAIRPGATAATPFTT